MGSLQGERHKRTVPLCRIQKGQPLKGKVFQRVFSKWTVIAVCAAIAVVVIVLVIMSGSGNRSMSDKNYTVGVGFEGLRVKRVIQAFGLRETAGMGGAYYDETVRDAVYQFQQENGLKATGETDLATWNALGFTKEEWNICGAYQSPAKVNAGASREEKIEAMIERAYDYLGDPYVIGASGPPGETYGLDCSGLMMQALYAGGIAMSDINPVTHAHPGHEYESRNIWNSDHFTVVDYKDRERGDLIFYCDRDGIVNHVALYLGDDEVIESWPNEVQVSPVLDKRHGMIKGVKRVFQ